MDINIFFNKMVEELNLGNIIDEKGKKLKSYIYEITRERYLKLNHERINDECKRGK